MHFNGGYIQFHGANENGVKNMQLVVGETTLFDVDMESGEVSTPLGIVAGGTLTANNGGDHEYTLPETTPAIAEGEETKRFAMIRTGLNKKLEFVDVETFCNWIKKFYGLRYDQSVGLGIDPRSTVKLDVIANASASTAIYAAGGTVGAVGQGSEDGVVGSSLDGNGGRFSSTNGLGINVTMGGG